MKCYLCISGLGTNPVSKTKIMTRAESLLESAIEIKDNNELNDYETNFIVSIESYDKAQLKTLSKKQFKLLERIANN